MNDLISRQAAIEATCYNCTEKEICNGICDDTDRLREMPTSELKQGKWIYTEVREYPISYNLVECPLCGWSHHSRPGEKGILTAEDVASDFNYCPRCGNIMRYRL